MTGKELQASTLATATLVAVFACVPAHAINTGTATAAFGQVGSAVCCSAVQITPNWVLTAHHVGASYTVGSTFSDAFGTSQVAAIHHFTPAALPEHDLTLVRLATPIAAAPALSLLADVIPYGDLASPIDATIVSAKNQAPRGYGFVSVVAVEPQGQAREEGPLVDVNYLVTLGPGAGGLPYVQGGDSGGALFLGHVSDSTSPLMGITSAYGRDKAGTTYSLFVELSRYRSWIDQTMAADLNDAQSVNWVTVGVPEPGAWALWLAGLGVLCAAARRPKSTTRPDRRPAG